MKQHVTSFGSSILAVSDPELLGESLDDAEKGIAITITENFYGSELFDEDTVIKALSAADNANIIGNRIVELAINNNLVNPQSVIMIDGVKHAQIYNLNI